jgi:hypothetical protein
MKKTLRLLLLASLATAAGFLSACQSASMIPSVDSQSFAAVPTVLQANPDMLGGLVGREAVSANPTTRRPNDKTQRAELDQRAYLIWKHSQNS